MPDWDNDEFVAAHNETIDEYNERYYEILQFDGLPPISRAQYFDQKYSTEQKQRWGWTYNPHEDRN